MRSQMVKLLRYQRIKRRKNGAAKSASFDHFARLYWRYHLKVYGPPSQLNWRLDD